LLIAADDALKSADEAGNKTYKRVDKKFRNVILLLSRFEKDFPFKDHRMVSREATIKDATKSPLTILYALEENLHVNVKFLSNSLPLK
jgi:hypothetical protein